MKLDQRFRELIACGLPIEEVVGKGLEITLDEVVAIKSAQDIVQIRDVTERADEEALSLSLGSIDETRTVPYVWSVESPDRGGDIIRQNGWELENYGKNNIALFNHDYDHPLGNGVDYKIATVKGKKALVGGIKFAPKDAGEFVESRFQLAKAGVLRATSVGFMAKNVRVVQDEKERADLGLGRWGVIFERQELLEITVCSVPMHQDAVRRALALVEHLVTPQGLKRLESDLSMTPRDYAAKFKGLCRAFVDMGRLSKSSEGGAVSTTPSEAPVPATATVERASEKELLALIELQTAVLTSTTKAIEQLSTVVAELSRKVATLGDVSNGAEFAPVSSPSDAKGIDLSQATERAAEKLRKMIKTKK